jgi:hypothetical protein
VGCGIIKNNKKELLTGDIQLLYYNFFKQVKKSLSRLFNYYCYYFFAFAALYGRVVGIVLGGDAGPLEVMTHLLRFLRISCRKPGVFSVLRIFRGYSHAHRCDSVLASEGLPLVSTLPFLSEAG